MPTLLDMHPFPWPMPEAQELHKILCDLYPSSKGAMFVAAKAGLDRSQLFEDQASYLLWREILDMGARALLNRKLVTIVRDQNLTTPGRAFLDALLADLAGSALPVGEPRGDDGAPTFLNSDDSISEPEALLFHDDLTLEIGRVSWLIDVLRKLQKFAPAVCRIQTNWSGRMKRGTAFRIAPSLLLTNWHLVDEKGTLASRVSAEFGFDDDGMGGGLPSTTVACEVATIRGDAAFDWAVVEPKQQLDDTIPILKLSDECEPVRDAPAFIIQHPGGERKRIAFVRNQITGYDDNVVHYLSDTRQGSSGSPVFAEDGRLLALHHRGGRPQEVAGKPPILKNEGIRIRRIVDGLVALGVQVP